MQAVRSVLSKAVESGRVPGVVAAVGSAESEHFLEAFGAAATDPVVPMGADSVFRIASMTKLVTSVAVMQLADDGRIDLDAPLGAYLPGFAPPEVLIDFDAPSGRYSTRPARREASLRELLSHTAGYGYWFLHEPLRLASGSEPDLFDPPFLIADPGTRFAYSTSTDVIGRIIEPVSSLSLDRFFAERIFSPLGMLDSGFNRPRNRERLVRVHRRSGRGFRQLPLERQDHPVRGGGGLYSTAGDYCRFLRCLLRGGELDGRRIISAASVREITRNQIGILEASMQRTALADRSNDFIFMDGTQKFGFGVMIESADRPRARAAGSFSWAGIFNTYFWADPANDVAAVLMLQLAPFASSAGVAMLQEFETAVYGDLQGMRTGSNKAR